MLVDAVENGDVHDLPHPWGVNVTDDFAIDAGRVTVGCRELVVPRGVHVARAFERYSIVDVVMQPRRLPRKSTPAMLKSQSIICSTNGSSGWVFVFSFKLGMNVGPLLVGAVSFATSDSGFPNSRVYPAISGSTSCDLPSSSRASS